jgi:hypothetical protein
MEEYQNHNLTGSKQKFGKIQSIHEKEKNNMGDEIKLIVQEKNLAYKKYHQTQTIRIMEGCGNRVSCRYLFKKLQTLPLTSQYMLSLFMFVVQNKNFFSTNNKNRNLDTRQRNNLYHPQAELTIYQKGAHYLGLNFFNNLPLEIKNFAGNQKKFKIVLKKFLYTYSFYTTEEYLSQS